MNRPPSTWLQCTSALLAGPLVGLNLLGCGAVSGSARQSAAVRMMVTLPDAGSVDVYANSTALAYNLGFGTVSSYVVFAPGAYTFSTHPAGAAAVAASTRGALQVNTQYTLLLGNVTAGSQTLLLQDQSQPAPSGQVAVRFIDQANRAGSVDLYLVPSGSSVSTTLPVKTGQTFSSALNLPGYLNIPSGAYTLVVFPSGTVPTSVTRPVYTGALASYPTGSARTIVLLDSQPVTGAGMQVILANDLDSATP